MLFERSNRAKMAINTIITVLKYNDDTFITGRISGAKMGSLGVDGGDERGGERWVKTTPAGV